ncbi:MULTISPECIES: hypothetical protein [Streptomyces]|uniref:DUF7144 family membrane protein n=1 Tax=Streptomyces TaxID=1883 RepID=UPI000CD53D02|nr:MULTISPECIES: hypothetical protein [Streptomyces]
MNSTAASHPGTVSRPVMSGWLGFAGVLLFTLGLIHLMTGLAALFKDDYFQVASGELLVFNYAAWGWIWLAIGVLQIAVGVGVLRGAAVARAAGVALAVVALVGQIAYLAAFPFWSLIGVGLCVLVIYALLTPPDDAVGI